MADMEKKKQKHEASSQQTRQNGALCNANKMNGQGGEDSKSGNAMSHRNTLKETASRKTAYKEATARETADTEATSDQAEARENARDTARRLFQRCARYNNS